MKLKRVISGGQTGTDQAALQAAIDKGVDHGGWCPPGRLCETGTIPEIFILKETDEERDQTAPRIRRSQRTIWNVRDSDGTLIFSIKNEVDIGSQLSKHSARINKKPYLVANPFDTNSISLIKNWLDENDIEVLNISGPSEDNYPGIYKIIHSLVSELLSLN